MRKTNDTIVVRVEHLMKYFPVRLGAFREQEALVHAVDGITFDIHQG